MVKVKNRIGLNEVAFEEEVVNYLKKEIKKRNLPYKVESEKK